MKKRKKLQRILAVIGIVLLLAMYIINIVLALIGSEAAQNMLKITMVLSIMIPILLYAFLMLMRRSDGFRSTPLEELDESQREEALRRLEAAAEEEKKGKKDETPAP